MSRDATPLVLSGDLTVRQAVELHVTFAEALGHGHHVALDCSAATRVDLSFLQLVLSARAAARSQAGDLVLLPPAAAVTEAACRAGLTGPGAPAAESAFWHASETGVPQCRKPS